MGRGSDRAEAPVAGFLLFAGAAVAALATASMVTTLGQDLLDAAHHTSELGLTGARSRLDLQGLTGRIPEGGGAIEALNLTVRVAPGSDPVRLEGMVLELANGSDLRALSHGASPGQGWFTATADRDEDDSVAEVGLINGNDLVRLDADLSGGANDLAFPPREPLRARLQPDPGLALEVRLETPPTYAGRTVIDILRG